MKDLIEKKGIYDSTIYVDAAAFGNIVSRLKSLKFDHIKIIIPNEEDKVKGKIFELQEFLNSQRDFSAVIISAENKQENEKIKILFKIHINKKLTFLDDTFQYISTDANDPMNKFNLFVSTNDQIRTNGLFQFMIDFLKEYAKGSTQLYLTTIVISILIAGLFIYGKGLEKSLIYIYLAAIVVISIIGLMILPKRGLHIKNNMPDPSLPLAVQELKKGWLIVAVSAIAALLMGLLGTYIAKILNF